MGAGNNPVNPVHPVQPWNAAGMFHHEGTKTPRKPGGVRLCLGGLVVKLFPWFSLAEHPMLPGLTGRANNDCGWPKGLGILRIVAGQKAGAGQRRMN